MNTKTEITNHKEAIKLLKAIEKLDNRIECTIDMIDNSFQSTFPELKARYENDLDTRTRAKAKLVKRYKETKK